MAHGGPPPQAEEPLGEDAICGICDCGDREDMMLLCDLCDRGWHRDCLKPAIVDVPEGDWFCKDCLKKGIPESYDFKEGDRVCIVFEEDCRWIGKIRKIEGDKGLIHFDGWKPMYDQWLPRKLFADLPPPDIMARVSHGRVPTKADDEKYQRKLEIEKAQAEVAETERQLKEIRDKIKAIPKDDVQARAEAKEEEREVRRRLPPKHKDHMRPDRPASQGGASSKSGKQHPGQFKSITTLGAGCDDGWSDCCVECGTGGELLCCDCCPRTYCLDCARLDKVPRGSWMCRPCKNAQQMIQTGGGIGSEKLLLQIQRLCEQFPMTHFLGSLSVDLARVRALADACREQGISLNGMGDVGTAKEAVERLNCLLGIADGNATAAQHQAAAAAGSSSSASPSTSTHKPAASAPSQGGAQVQAKAALPAPKLSVVPKYSKYEEVVTRFSQDGVCKPGISLTDTQVNICREAVCNYYNKVKYTLQTLQLTEVLESKGFHEFKLRCPGRYDMQVPELEQKEYDFLRQDAPWMDAVRAILGEDCRLIVMGCMLSQPGSKTQQWHSDGDHLSDDEHLPPYAVNIFVPLVDVDAQLGPTEFVPTTHLLFNYEPVTQIQTVTFPTPAGEILLFDYRVKHRGLGNKGSHARPMLYITYATKSYADRDNFSKKRYAKLPPLLEQRPPRSELPVDREERMRVLQAINGANDTKGGKATSPVKKDKGAGKGDKEAKASAGNGKTPQGGAFKKGEGSSAGGEEEVKGRGKRAEPEEQPEKALAKRRRN